MQMKTVFYSMAFPAFLGFFAVFFAVDAGHFEAVDRLAAARLTGSRALGAFTVLGDQWLVVTVSAVLLLVLWVQRRWRAMLFVLIAVGAGNVLNQYLKHLVKRERPDFPHGLETFSFPSGHAMVGLLLLFTVTYLVTEQWQMSWRTAAVWSMAVFLALLVGLSRIALSVHYFSDVLAGWCAGYAWFVGAAVWYESRNRQFKQQTREGAD